MDQQNQVMAAAVSGLGVVLLELVRRFFERRQGQLDAREDERKEKLITSAQTQAQDAYEDQIEQLRRELRESKREVRVRDQQLQQARDQMTELLHMRASDPHDSLQPTVPKHRATRRRTVAKPRES